MAETQAEIQVPEPSAPPAGKETAGAPPGDRTSGSESLFKNAYFLMLSTGVSAVLGLGFWLVAARYYSEEAVGQGSAAIAAMRLLASITATTMIGAVVRFVPRAGRATGSLVWRAYAASSVVVAVAAFVFLLTLDLWGATYAPLGTAAAGTAFVIACVAWALLTLQDGVLTGLRRSGWVPIGNAVFSVGKLILLAVCATALPVLGIFVSWAVAIAFSTLPLGWLIFRRLIPRQAAADRDLEPPRLREMGRFLAGDSLGALFSLAMINLLPVMVAVRFSAAENGYFYVAYTVGGTMEFMAINMASSLTAHASHDPRQLAEGVRGALRRMTLLLVPVVLVLVVFAPQILLPFHEDYAEHGTTVLRLLAAGALPRVVVELYIGVLRVQGRTGVLAALQGAMCTLVLGSAALLFAPAGIAGAGWAVLISMTLIAAVSAVGLRSALRRNDRPPVGRSSATPAYGTHWARLNATAGYGTNWARRAAHERDGVDEDTVTLFIGRPGYEREALQADTLALIKRPPHESEAVKGSKESKESKGSKGTEEAEGRDESAREAARDRSAPAGSRERWVTGGLWGLLGMATVAFWTALRDLPWLDGPSENLLTGRQLLAALPLTALVAGGLLLVVFVGAVTLRAARGALLPGAALGSVLLALYAVPPAFGREPSPVAGAWCAKAARFLAEGMGLDGPEPLLRWAPPAVQLLCLVPLWLLLARTDRWLTWPGRWGVLYLVAVGGWVWRQELAPAALPLFVVLVLAAAVLSLATRGRAQAGQSRGAVSGTAPAGGSSRSYPPPGSPRGPGPR
ncbi:lipopolysaccharide biosynthesis protein [Streptomyces asoensis]|uniref:Lipopolysaccharide biosynthesis protein n=2 Tax=Streptomyces asoensis TaxID=249586 RepID=A0A6M4WS91_9ACTN|nr:lipopolysaccharide biosynthesis protein [Streptomyces asoensis]QJT03404.1 lipopolysaccharide biosynthesis protein [Streptomyces asoensis]